MDEKQLLAAIGQLIDEKIAGLATKEDIERAERQMRVVVENGYQRIENLLREDYSRVAGAAAKGAAAADTQAEIKSTVADHNRALQNHNERLTTLEKKVI